jgi:hypothetical protein
VVDDELIGIPPGEAVDDTDELELNGMPNAGAETPDGGAETRPGGGARLESSDPPALAGWPSFVASPPPLAAPTDPGDRASEPVG